MSQTSRIVQERVVSVPKHLLKYRDEISPYGKAHMLKSAMGNRILLNDRKAKSQLSRGQTMIERKYDDYEDLVKVERNYVRELIKSPIKMSSRSPLMSRGIKMATPSKGKITRNRFESLTACDFINGTPVKKRSLEMRRVKFALTPEILNKKNNMCKKY